MFDRLKEFFASSGNGAEKAGNETAIAVAALLVEAAAADENYSDAERKLISVLLVGEFGVEPSSVEMILREAETRQRDAVDLFRFIREVKPLSPDEKIKLVEALWRVILSDGEKDAFEDMLVRRVCGLIHVSDVESGLARRRVLEGIAS